MDETDLHFGVGGSILRMRPYDMIRRTANKHLEKESHEHDGSVELSEEATTILDDSSMPANTSTAIDTSSTSPDDSQLGTAAEQIPEYTNMLCNRLPTPNVARLLVFLVFFVVGATQSYQAVIILELQEKGASLGAQAKLSVCWYPYIFKIVFAPFMDSYFIPRIGKCKTYLVAGLAALGLVLLSIAPVADALNTPDQINTLVVVWFFVNCVVVVFQIAGEMWIIKLFHTDDEKGKGSVFFDIGSSIGSFLAYNILVPLSSVKWINSHRDPGNKVTQPFITPQQVLSLVGVCALVLGGIILIFVAEKVDPAPTSKRSQNLVRVIKLLPKFFSQKNMRKFLLFGLVIRFFPALFDEVMMLKVLDNGISKTTLVNLSSFTFPLYLLVSFISIRFMQKGSMMRRSYYMGIYAVLLNGLQYLVYLDLAHNRNIKRTENLILLCSVLEKFQFGGNLSFAYISTITPEDIASTFLTFLMCWSNLSNMLPATIGLKLADWMPHDFERMYSYSLLAQVLVVVCLQGYWMNTLDTLSKDDYKLSQTPREMTENKDKTSDLTDSFAK